MGMIRADVKKLWIEQFVAGLILLGVAVMVAVVVLWIVGHTS